LKRLIGGGGGFIMKGTIYTPLEKMGPGYKPAKIGSIGAKSKKAKRRRNGV
jgi:hypothetical protein